MARKQITERLTHLDPHQDCQEVVLLLTCHVFPWNIECALEFDLFRTYAIPAISSLIVKTREFQRCPRKRYDDSQMLLSRPIWLTARNRPTYPQGYKLEELGTFVHGNRSN